MEVCKTNRMECAVCSSMEIKKKYVPDGNQGHWLIYGGNGKFLCSCDDAELTETLMSIQREMSA